MCDVSSWQILFSNSGSGCQALQRSSLPGPLFSPRAEMKEGKDLRECRDVLPMNRAAVAFQQPCPGQKIRPRRDATQLDAVSGGISQKRKCRGMIERLRIAAGTDEDDIEPAGFCDADIRLDPNAVRCGDVRFLVWKYESICKDLCPPARWRRAAARRPRPTTSARSPGSAESQRAWGGRSCRF